MSDELILYAVTNGVATLTMNNPKRLNGRTLAMQEKLREGLNRAAQDEAVGAAVLTGTGKYYSAGADLSGSFRLQHPKKLRALIRDGNYRLFDGFIQFPKPILAAVNGIALGAPVTTAVLCDAILASDKAAFTTPFARLGVPRRGLLERPLSATLRRGNGSPNSRSGRLASQRTRGREDRPRRKNRAAGTACRGGPAPCRRLGCAWSAANLPRGGHQGGARIHQRPRIRGNRGGISLLSVPHESVPIPVGKETIAYP